MNDISVIVPLAPGETAWQELLPALLSLAISNEILLLCADAGDAENIGRALANEHGIRVVAGGSSRAALMNTGAKISGGKYLWFLHADSRLQENCAAMLEKAMHGRPSLFYFDLVFLPDGPAFMIFNTIGTWFRSHVFKMPFGDQGFFIERSLFVKTAGYDEQVEYGEDHLLVWQAHQQGIPVRCIGASLETSARKYRNQGWANVTVRHLRLTVKQAWPEFCRLLRQRWPVRG